METITADDYIMFVVCNKPTQNCSVYSLSSSGWSSADKLFRDELVNMAEHLAANSWMSVSGVGGDQSKT